MSGGLTRTMKATGAGFASGSHLAFRDATRSPQPSLVHARAGQSVAAGRDQIAVGVEHLCGPRCGELVSVLAERDGFGDLLGPREGVRRDVDTEEREGAAVVQPSLVLPRTQTWAHTQDRERSNQGRTRCLDHLAVTSERDDARKSSYWNARGPARTENRHLHRPDTFQPAAVRQRNIGQPQRRRRD